MKNKFLFLLLSLIIFSTCKDNLKVSKIEGKRISVDENLTSNTAIEDYVKPYRERVQKDLDSTLAYAPNTYSKKDGELNTAIGNFLADAVLQMSDPVFKSRTGKNIDFVVLNHGGIRSIISKGNITTRTAYEVMPFDNSVVVAPIKGQQIKDMLNYLSSVKRAHPISNFKIQLNEDYSIKEALINNSEIDYNKTYFVATSDYLYNGGDRMNFFKSKDSLYDINYKIRNLLIDYFKDIDTLQPSIDDRFTKK